MIGFPRSLRGLGTKQKTKSNAPALRRTAAVMGNWRHVLNGPDFNARGGQRADGRLAAGAGAVHPHFQRPHAMFAGLVGSIHGCLLGGKGSAFARSAEAQRTGALPRKGAAFAISNGDDGVIERSLDVSDPVRDVLAFLLLEYFFLAFGGRCSGAGCCCWFIHVCVSSLQRSLART